MNDTGNDPSGDQPAQTADESAAANAVTNQIPQPPMAGSAVPQPQPPAVGTETAGYGPPQYGSSYNPAWPPLPPRRRWIAPERRKAVIAICVVAALVLFGVGMLVGHLVTGHDGSRFGPGPGRGGYSQLNPRQGGNRLGPRPGRAGGTTAPTPQPSATS